MNEYQELTVWDVIKRFIAGWVVGLGILAVYSCVKYRKYIGAVFTDSVFTDSVLSWINAVIPIIIVLFAIIYMIKSIFR